MPPIQADADAADPATWRALRELLDANDQWRAAYQQWIRAHAPRGADTPETQQLRDAEKRVSQARARVTELRGPLEAADKAWSGH